MKRFELILLLLVLVLVLPSWADLLKIGKIDTYDAGFKSVYPIVVRCNLNDKSEHIYLDANEGGYVYQLKLKGRNIAQLRKLIDKVLEWHDTAVTHNVQTNVRKTVEVLVYSEIWWRVGARGDAYHSPTFYMEGTFVYVNPEASGVILVMANPSSTDNPYIRPDMKDRFISVEELYKLKEILNPEFIEKKLDEFIKKQDAIDDLFQ